MDSIDPGPLPGLDDDSNSGPGWPLPKPLGPSVLDPMVTLAVGYVRAQAMRQNLDDATRAQALRLLRAWPHYGELSADQRVTVALHFRSAGEPDGRTDA